MDPDRAVRALEDVVAVEHVAPGFVRVVTWSDAYPVDARDAGCNCPDKEYNDDVLMCKHEQAALLADADYLPTPFVVADDLDARPAATDGGQDRPDECECAEFSAEIPCAPCAIAGFDEKARGVA